MTTIRAACLLLCLAMPGWALAASTPPTSLPTAPAVTRPLDLSDLAAPVFANFSARDGLPEQVMVDIRTDRDGFVWAASPQGVSRYDGRRWVPSDDPAMAHPVNNQLVDSTGLLWARFYDMNTNEPFFTGRDSERKGSITEVENERRTGYAWYGSWAAKLLATEYPAWLRKLNKN